jgi:hypothetical protein
MPFLFAVDPHDVLLNSAARWHHGRTVARTGCGLDVFSEIYFDSAQGASSTCGMRVGRSPLQLLKHSIECRSRQPGRVQSAFSQAGNPSPSAIHSTRLRATFATWHLWAGVDLCTVQQWLGHSDMESTMRYLKPSRSQATRAKFNATFRGAR